MSIPEHEVQANKKFCLTLTCVNTIPINSEQKYCRTCLDKINKKIHERI